MKLLISYGIWTASYLITVALFFTDAFLLLFTFPFDKDRRILHAQCYWWSDAIIALNPNWELKVEGLENIDKQRTYVIVSNHQSLADIIVLYKIRTQFKWVAKASLFKIPFIGWCLYLTKHIKLLRGDFGSIKKIYREAASWLRRGMSVMFFPEGTRSETGELGEFQNGAFKLALKEKVPVLPIAVSGTTNAIPKGGRIFDTKASCRVKVLPAVETSEMSVADFSSLRDDIFKRIELAQA